MAKSLAELMLAGKYRKALRGIKSGRLDPASAPDGVYFAARAKNPDLLRRFLAAGADPNYGARPRPIQVAVHAGLLANVDLRLDFAGRPGLRGAPRRARRPSSTTGRPPPSSPQEKESRGCSRPWSPQGPISPHPTTQA
jgi:hypothetical protein